MQTKPVSRQIIRWGWTLSVFILLSYLICVVFGLLVPGRFQIHEAWALLLPGFEGLTLPGWLQTSHDIRTLNAQHIFAFAALLREQGIDSVPAPVAGREFRLVAAIAVPHQ